MKRNSCKGISLISLVITIIILVILTVGVSKYILYDGYIDRAENTAAATSQKIAAQDNAINSIIEGVIDVPSETKANPPVLLTNMIAVKWNGTNWVKADESKTDWYEYGTTSSTKKWANAVTVKEDIDADHPIRSKYLAATEGTIINIEDIIGMYVWIPRYSYRIVRGYHSSNNGNSTENSGLVEIQFIHGTGYGVNNIEYNATTTENYTKFPDGYVLHPAFTFGTKEIPGFWVAKFEASSSATDETGKNTLSTNGASTDSPTITVGTMGVNQVTIRPNVTSWRNTNIINMYRACINMTETGNIHGLGSTEEDITEDSHLMNDIEWGAVAYLTQSAYGNAQVSNDTGVWTNSYYEGDSKYGTRTGMVGTTRDDATSDEWVQEDNDDDDISFYRDNGVVTVEYGENGTKTFYEYYTQQGQKGSTTGTIYGVYDMSGGAWEITTNYLSGVDYETTYASSTGPKARVAYFEEFPAEHKTVYIATNTVENQGSYNYNYEVEENKAIYGNAVYETSSTGNDFTSWNSGRSRFGTAGQPCLARGSRAIGGSYASIFSFTGLDRWYSKIYRVPPSLSDDWP